MASPNRTTVLNKAHKVLKKHYKPVLPTDRPVLDHLLLACCLENAQYEPAQAALDAVLQGFFDLNEVRVSTVQELAEVMSKLPDPAAAATNLKRALQGIFESTYSFDLDWLRKQNQGQAVQKLKKIASPTPFCLNYVVQAGLGGHAIPIDDGAMKVLVILGVATGKEPENAVAGLERAIAKNKGAEFSSLLHQLGADLVASPYSPNVHKVLLEIDPECKDRLPKRLTKAQREKAAAEQAAAAAARKTAAAKKKATQSRKPAAIAPAAKKAVKKAPPKAKATARLTKRKPR